MLMSCIFHVNCTCSDISILSQISFFRKFFLKSLHRIFILFSRKQAIIECMINNKSINETTIELQTIHKQDITISEVESVSEKDRIYFPQSVDYLDMDRQYRQLMFLHEAAIEQLTAKLNILKAVSYTHLKLPTILLV